MWPAAGGEQPMAMGRGPASPPPRSSTRLVAAPHSAWQSPVPYLFGGLAAMLGMIALSLLALACSYWKLSGSLLADELQQDGTGTGSRRRGDGDVKATAAGTAGPGGDLWREPHVVVIMAGDERPTFLATPASSSGWGGVDVQDAYDGVACGGAPDEGRCVECGAISSRPADRARPGGDGDGDGDELGRPSRDEQGGVSGSSSVVGER